MATLDRLGPPSPAAAPMAQTWRPRRAIVAALSVTATIALLQVVLSSSFTYTGHSMQQLEAKRSELKAELYEMEAEVAALTSLDRTERLARDRLGMVPTRPSQYVSVAVEAPQRALLPRPLVELERQGQSGDQPWWQTLYELLPIR